MILADGRMDRHEEANSHFAQICESTEKGLNETFNEKKSTKVHHAFVLYDLLVVIKKERRPCKILRLKVAFTYSSQNSSFNSNLINS
jgi:hypothetical protein